MADLLRLFEGKALHRALVDAGHDVSVRTVQRWVAGDSQPRAQDMAAIRRLLELPDEEAAPPGWARRLLAGQDELLRRAGVDPADVEATAAEVVARVARRRSARRGTAEPRIGR